MGYGKVVSKEELEFIIRCYNSGMSMKEIGNLIDRRASTISSIFKHRGIIARPSAVRRYDLNDCYFDDLNSEGPAYWLGALIADGCISGNRVHLDAKADDVEWLEQFKTALGYTGKVYTYQRHPSSYSKSPKSTLSFTSVYMQDILKSYGFDNDKTHSAHFCEAVPDEMRRHHIRGLVDGDGSLHYLKQGDTWGISFVGTEALVTGVVNHLSSVLNLDIKVNPHKMIYSFHVGGVDKTKKIVDYLYSGSTYVLARKKLLAEECMKRVSKKRDLSHITSEDINELFVKYNNWNSVAIDLNLTISGLYQVKKRLGMETYRGKMWGISKEDILVAYKEFGTWEGVAKFYGVDRHTVRNKIISCNKK